MYPCFVVQVVDIFDYTGLPSELGYAGGLIFSFVPGYDTALNLR